MKGAGLLPGVLNRTLDAHAVGSLAAAGLQWIIQAFCEIRFVQKMEMQMIAVRAGDLKGKQPGAIAILGYAGQQGLGKNACTLACCHFQGMPNCPERNDAVAHSVIGAIELGFDELLGPTVFDPVCSVVSQFCHRQILPDFQGLDFQGLDFSSLGLGCQFVIYLAPMNSNIPGSVDADPRLIAANLSDDNLNSGNLNGGKFDVMAYLDDGRVAGVSVRPV